MTIEGFYGLRIGDKFTIANEDKPAWCEGQFVVTEVLDTGYRVKRVKERVSGNSAKSRQNNHQ